MPEVLFVHGERVQGHDVDFQLEISSYCKAERRLASAWWTIQEVTTSIGDTAVSIPSPGVGVEVVSHVLDETLLDSFIKNDS